MPDLTHVLQGNDLGFLRMVANAWGIELNAPDVHVAQPMLVNSMRDGRLVKEIVETLPPEACQALQALLENEARLSWSLFTRRFGEVRKVGAAKRDRERPDLNPVSAAELLWYRGLIGRAFFDLPPEPQEYAYIPSDLLEFLNPLIELSTPSFGRPASALEAAFIIHASDWILDDACSYLAAVRLDLDPVRMEFSQVSIPVSALAALLRCAGLLGENGLPVAEKVREFLEAPRAEALVMLVRPWLQSRIFDELRLLPGLRFEGDWRNDPLIARHALLDLLSGLPQQSWWSLPAFINAVHERSPDFQRPAGDYDSWFIFHEIKGVYLRGFSSWGQVDGALIRFMITGPMRWLGIYDLASPAPLEEISAFRPSASAEALWHCRPPEGFSVESEPLHISSEGYLRLNRLTPRSVRYQVARFCIWDPSPSPDEYHYHLTPFSLQRAKKQGLQLKHLFALLHRHSSAPLPPILVQALERWEKLGVQAILEKKSVLRVSSPEILSSLRKTHAVRYLGETLNPTTVVIKPGGESNVRDALVEIGYLPDGLDGVDLRAT